MAYYNAKDIVSISMIHSIALYGQQVMIFTQVAPMAHYAPMFQNLISIFNPISS